MTKEQWLEHFNNAYYPYLNPQNNKKWQTQYGFLKNNLWQRSEGFKLIFEKLLEIKQKNFEIVETGVCRKKGNWLDGQSTVMFADLVDNLGGHINTVDISVDSLNEAKNIITSKNCSFTLGDSVDFLKNYPSKDSVDLYYLDSYDVQYRKSDEKSSQHHLNEFKVIEPYLKNCIVAIDDNAINTTTNTRIGKGRKIYEYLKEKDMHPIFDEYMIVYKF